ncbi:hypothetical protein ACB092_09G045100 [Castanea dentata]
MALQSHQLHFVMVPLPFPGHLISTTDMARLFAQRGVIFTIVTTPLNLPLHEAGLPEGCENIDTVPSRGLFRNFFDAVSKLQQPLEQLLEEMEPSPSCIIADKNLAWTGDIANKFHIPRILFDGTSCFNLLCCHNILASKVNESASVSDLEPFVVPGLPDRIELTRAQLPTNLNTSLKDFKDLHEKINASEEGGYGVVVNSFVDLEPEYVKGYRKANGNKVWCIGPVSLSNKADLDKAQRANKSSIDENQCLKWLDLWPQNSVVYACLGSLSRLTLLQLIELGLGLEACGRPFIWVIREDKNGEIEKWIIEDGFEERAKGRGGLLIRGPQVLILSHPAIGGFLTHCGWNSMLEAVCAGVPMVTWPMFADQFFNEKLVVQVLKIGGRVGAEIAIPLGDEEKFGVLVKREEVRDALGKIMTEGKETEDRRERARKLAEMAKIAIEGGSSYLDIALLIEEFSCKSYK